MLSPRVLLYALVSCLFAGISGNKLYKKALVDAALWESSAKFGTLTQSKSDSMVECAAICNGYEDCTSFALVNQVDCQLGKKLTWDVAPLVSGSKEIFISTHNWEPAMVPDYCYMFDSTRLYADKEILSGTIVSAHECRIKCQANPLCTNWHYYGFAKTCYLKDDLSLDPAPVSPWDKDTRGPRNCEPEKCYNPQIMKMAADPVCDLRAHEFDFFRLTTNCERSSPTYTYWLGGLGATGMAAHFDIYLGCRSLVQSVELRNSYNMEQTERATKDFVLQISDEVVYSNSITWTTVAMGTLSSIKSDACTFGNTGCVLCDSLPTQTFHFASTHTARFVRFIANSYHGDGPGLRNIVLR